MIFDSNSFSDVAGEYIRSDVRDGQNGVELILDTQVIDMATCEPVNYALVEIWRESSSCRLAPAQS